MSMIALRVIKADVYKEVAKTTSYTGAKMAEEAAYDRIFTTDADQELLERFWNESKDTVTGSLKQLLGAEQEQSGVYTLTLQVSSSYDTHLTDSIQRSLFSFFVKNIVSKWFSFANKPDTDGVAKEAASDLEDVLRKAYYKKRPSRPTYI